jgi:large subunit ribosomal protein L24
VATVKQANPQGSVKKGEVVTARRRAHPQGVRRDDGTYIAFDENAAVIIDAPEQPARHAHLRPGGPRAARAQLHEDRLARPGGALTWPRIRKDDTVIIDRRQGPRQDGPRPARRPEEAEGLVEGLNIIKRHTAPAAGARRPARRAGRRRVEKAGPIHVSNVMLVDPKENKPTRVGSSATRTAARRRVAKRSGTRID